MKFLSSDDILILFIGILGGRWSRRIAFVRRKFKGLVKLFASKLVLNNESYLPLSVVTSTMSFISGFGFAWLILWTEKLSGHIKKSCNIMSSTTTFPEFADCTQFTKTCKIADFFVRIAQFHGESYQWSWLCGGEQLRAIHNESWKRK